MKLEFKWEPKKHIEESNASKIDEQLNEMKLKYVRDL
jgi:hypothetical protein